MEALGVAGDLNLETVSGEMILADSAAERVRASTVSGAITCDLDNPRRSEIRLEHHLRQRSPSGSARTATSPSSLNATCGRITSGFPQVRSRRRAGRAHSHGRARRRRG